MGRKKLKKTSSARRKASKNYYSDSSTDSYVEEVMKAQKKSGEKPAPYVFPEHLKLLNPKTPTPKKPRKMSLLRYRYKSLTARELKIKAEKIRRFNRRYSRFCMTYEPPQNDYLEELSATKKTPVKKTVNSETKRKSPLKDPITPSSVGKQQPSTNNTGSLLSPIKNPDLLKEVIAFPDMGHCTPNLSSRLRECGATVVNELTDEVTHVVFSRGNADVYQKALGMNVQLVHLGWLETCIIENQVMPGDKFAAREPKPDEVDWIYEFAPENAPKKDKETEFDSNKNETTPHKKKRKNTKRTKSTKKSKKSNKKDDADYCPNLPAKASNESGLSSRPKRSCATVLYKEPDFVDTSKSTDNSDSEQDQPPEPDFYDPGFYDDLSWAYSTVGYSSHSDDSSSTRNKKIPECTVTSTVCDNESELSPLPPLTSQTGTGLDDAVSTTSTPSASPAKEPAVQVNDDEKKTQEEQEVAVSAVETPTTSKCETIVQKLVLINLSAEEEEFTRKTCQLLGNYEIDYDVTSASIIISTQNSKSMIFLQGIMEDCVVLDFSWVKTSYKRKKWQRVAKYRLQYYLAAMDKRKHGKISIFDKNTTICVSTSDPDFRLLQDLVVWTGANLTDDISLANVIIEGDPLKTAGYRKVSCIHVNKTWLHDSICSLSKLPVFSYRVK